MKWGEKKPEREEKEEEERSGSKVGPGLNGRDLGARNYGVELGARVTGAELPAMSSTEPRNSAPVSASMAPS